jgi:acyl-coenzyme A synthetase/AMP-(fatty) acid ligase/thioesterase domain-containing protein
VAKRFYDSNAVSDAVAVRTGDGTPVLQGRPVRPLCPADTALGVVGRLRDVVTAAPAALAVADGERELTYEALAAASAGVLAALRAAVGGDGAPVGVLCSHDATAVAAIVGAVASGAPVLVLDPLAPAPRLALCAERAGARLVVADASHEELAAGWAGRVLVPGGDAPAADPEELWRRAPDPASAAVLAFTSGSTGVPKLVVNDHRLLVRDAWNSGVATGCLGADDVLAHTLPLAFHAGLTTTLVGLLTGATLRLYDARSRGVEHLPGWIAAVGATVMVTSPAILRALLALPPSPGSLRKLRSVTVAGEALHGRDAERLRAVLARSCVVRHRYGSSETGLIAEHAIGAADPPLEGVVPVGRAVGATRVGLVPLDPPAGERDGQEGDGDAGRGVVTVTAPDLALGYWGDDRATAAAFTDNADGTRTYLTSDLGRLLPDGTLVLTGRVDHSVKIRGYLVDPGEVDAVLFSLPEVREAVVVGQRCPGRGPAGEDGAPPERARLVAYVVPSGREATIPALRSALRAALPAHMVPEVVLLVDALPRTGRGKIDRGRLPEPPPPAAGTADEQSGWEELVGALWADVLGVDRVALTDDFFSLGGDSLAVETLLGRVTGELDVPPDVATSGLLAQAPTLGEFAARLRQSSGRRSFGPLVPLQPCGTRPPLFLVAGGGGLGVAFIPWARRLGPDRPTWALQSPALEGRGLPDRSVRSLARRYVAEIRRVQPRGPYHIAGHSFGGLVAFEMAHQLRDAGHEVAFLGLLDSFPPDPAYHPDVTWRPLASRLRSAAGLVWTAARSTPGGEHHWRFFDRATAMGRRYRGRPWPGRALVVVASTPQKARRSHWGPWLTGRWSLVDVGGDHLSMTRCPWADEVAGALAQALSEVSGSADALGVTSRYGTGRRGRRRDRRRDAAP